MNDNNLDGLTPEEVSESLHNTTEAEVVQGEAPANEITTLTPEPEEQVELTPPAEPTLEEVQETTESTTPSMDADSEVDAADMNTHSENSAEADQRVAQLTDVNNMSTGNNEVVIEAPSSPSEVAPTVTPIQPVDEWQIYLKQIEAQGNANLSMIIFTLNQYLTVMKPKTPTTVKQGADAQLSLWQAIYNTINKNNTNFKDAWALWLNIFNHYSGSIFSITYAFRFFEFIRMPRDQAIAFQRILNLLILTADPTTRATNLKRIDLERSLSVYFTEANKQQVMSFYM